MHGLAYGTHLPRGHTTWELATSHNLSALEAGLGALLIERNGRSANGFVGVQDSGGRSGKHHQVSFGLVSNQGSRRAWRGGTSLLALMSAFENTMIGWENWSDRLVDCCCLLLSFFLGSFYSCAGCV
jgi:hypothetical protein